MHVERSPELCVNNMKAARDIAIWVMFPHLEVADPRESERSRRR